MNSGHGAELRFLAISECETGQVDKSAELVLSAFTLAGSDRSEREMPERTAPRSPRTCSRPLGSGLAAAAVGRAAPYQDNYVDTLGTVGNRLRAFGDEHADERRCERALDRSCRPGRRGA